MTLSEFKAWYDGYVHSLVSLTEEDINIIRNKLDEIIEPVHHPYTIPNLTVPYCGDCINCEEHEYPDIWHGTIPPSCKKCGKQALFHNITYTVNVQVNDEV